MKIPIAGKTYTVRFRKNYEGASFYTDTQEIIIGTGLPQERQAEYFLHEILEAICVERCVRYFGRPDAGSGDLVFVMTHHEFEIVVADLAAALRGRLRIRKAKHEE